MCTLKTDNTDAHAPTSYHTNKRNIQREGHSKLQGHKGVHFHIADQSCMLGFIFSKQKSFADKKNEHSMSIAKSNTNLSVLWSLKKCPNLTT